MVKNLLTLILTAFISVAFVPKTFAQGLFEGYSTEVSLQATAGSQGLGADLKFGIAPPISLRLGGSILPISANNLISFNVLHFSGDGTAKFLNAHLFADYTPLEDYPWLRVVAGAGYLYKATALINLKPGDGIKYGQIVVDNDKIGNLDVNVSWKGFAPYLGVGLLRSFPSDAFNINFDVGAYYLSAPHSQFSGTGLLSNNGAAQATQLDGNMKNFRFLPVLQVNFNLKIY